MLHNDPVSLDNLESSYLTQPFLMHEKEGKKRNSGGPKAKSIFCSFIHRHELKTYMKKTENQLLQTGGLYSFKKRIKKKKNEEINKKFPEKENPPRRLIVMLKSLFGTSTNDRPFLS